jgi:hypothetical protein
LKSGLRNRLDASEDREKAQRRHHERSVGLSS